MRSAMGSRPDRLATAPNRSSRTVSPVVNSCYTYIAPDAADGDQRAAEVHW